jgi:formate hydrogenlyase subunit 6/NADH:ubiquinone oxidoreductase subunit I
LPSTNGEKNMARKIRVPSMMRRAFTNTFCKPATTKFPFIQRNLSSNFRGQPIFDVNLCIGCGICSKECPSQAIIMISVDGKKNPEFQLDKCVFCYQCSDSCPKKAIKNSEYYQLATTDKSSLTIRPQVCSVPEFRKP